MFVNAIVLSLATSALLYSATVDALYYNGKITHPKMLYVDADTLLSPAGFTEFYAFGRMDVVLDHFAEPVGLFYINNINRVGPHSDGRLSFIDNAGASTYYGTAMTCNSNKRGTWSLHLDDNLRLYTRSACGTIAFDNGILADAFPYWAFDHIHGVTFVPPNDPRNQTAGKGAYVYYLDSGSTVSLYPLIAKFASNATAMVADESSPHFVGMINPLISYWYGGMSLGAQPGVIKITEGDSWDDIVQEASIIKAFKFIFTGHSLPGGTIQRIVHNSAVFTDGNSAVVDCAYQWAFRQGVYVIQPAGNNNVLRNTRNPYVLTMGGYNKPVGTASSKSFENSVYGDVIDLWAPAYLVTRFLAGTSRSAALTTAALAQVVSYWPARLRNVPNKGYRYLMDLASTNRINGSDPKVVASPRVGTKSLSIARMKTLVPSGLDAFDINTAPNFCGQLGLDANVPNWDALIAKADPNRWGNLVYDTTPRIPTSTGFNRLE